MLPSGQMCLGGGASRGSWGWEPVGTRLHLRCISVLTPLILQALTEHFPGTRPLARDHLSFRSSWVSNKALCSCPEIPQPSTPVTCPSPIPAFPHTSAWPQNPVWSYSSGGRATGKAQAAAAGGQQLARRGTKSGSPEEAGQGRGGAGRVHPSSQPEGESRGAFVPCQSGVTTWCATSLSPPGTKDQPRSARALGAGDSWGIPPALPPRCPLLGLGPQRTEAHTSFSCAPTVLRGTLAPSLRRLSQDPRSRDLPTVLALPTVPDGSR